MYRTHVGKIITGGLAQLIQKLIIPGLTAPGTSQVFISASVDDEDCVRFDADFESIPLDQTRIYMVHETLLGIITT